MNTIHIQFGQRTLSGVNWLNQLVFQLNIDNWMLIGNNVFLKFERK